MSLRIPLLLAALLALLPASAVALTPPEVTASVDSADPERLARHCVRTINAVADRAVATIADTTGATIQRIRRLDASGASDREIMAAGRAGAERVNRVARSAIGTIEQLTDRCVRALIAAGASRELVGRVIAASNGAQRGIAGARERGVTAIQQAVRAALG